jgi:hypothetical protein
MKERTELQEARFVWKPRRERDFHKRVAALPVPLSSEQWLVTPALTGAQVVPTSDQMAKTKLRVCQIGA